MSNNRRKFRAPSLIKRGKAGLAKSTNLQKQAKKLQSRMETEGKTAWLVDAWKRVELRAKKYGVKV